MLVALYSSDQSFGPKLGGVTTVLLSPPSSMRSVLLHLLSISRNVLETTGVCDTNPFPSSESLRFAWWSCGRLKSRYIPLCPTSSISFSDPVYANHLPFFPFPSNVSLLASALFSMCTTDADLTLFALFPVATVSSPTSGLCSLPPGSLRTFSSHMSTFWRSTPGARRRSTPPAPSLTTPSKNGMSP